MRSRIASIPAAFLAAALALVAPAARAQSAADSEAERKIHDLCVEKLGKAAEPVRATVTGDRAILSGEVGARAVRHLAKEVALAVPGIRDVNNEIRLARELPLTGKVAGVADDAKLEMQAKGRLETQVGMSAAKALEVEAVDGWVSLRGTLPDAEHKDLAIRAVRSLAGVTKVVDLISVAR